MKTMKAYSVIIYIKLDWLVAYLTNRVRGKTTARTNWSKSDGKFLKYINRGQKSAFFPQTFV